MAGKNTKPKKSSTLTKFYLRGYNLVQVLGWSYVLYKFLQSDFTSIGDPSLWHAIKCPLLIFQNVAALEIVHAATGLVPSNPILTTFQVLSRVMVVCGVLLATPENYAPSSPGLPLAIVAWTITEIIRYMYYFMGLVGYIPFLLTWLRYTLFIVLYPIGVTGELLCIFSATKYASAHPEAWSYVLPNNWNFLFSYYYTLIVTMLTYIPIFPQLYMHMFAQRRKILGGSEYQKKTK